MVRKDVHVNQGELRADSSGVHGPSPEEPQCAGVRAPIVARKSRNGEGAKVAQESG
jgi:hypothetical protein